MIIILSIIYFMGKNLHIISSQPFGYDQVKKHLQYQFIDSMKTTIGHFLIESHV